MIWAALALALVLRVINLNQSLWLDEAISALAVRDYSYSQIVSAFIIGDTHPPLYYFILKAWSGAFGYWEPTLRVLSVIFGVLTVYVVYLIAKKIGGKKLGIVSSFLLATAPLHIYYSQEIRMYSLSALAVSFAVFLFIRLLDKNPNQKDWILFSLSLLLIGLTDYLPLTILPVFWVYSFLRRKEATWWKKFLFSHILLLTFLAFWYPVFYKQSLGAKAALPLFPEWAKLLGEANFKELALVWMKFVLGRISFVSRELNFLIIAIVSAPFIYSLFKALKVAKKHLLLWLWFVLPIALAFLGAIFVPGFSYFRFIFVLPAFYFLIAVGLSKTKYKEALTLLLILANLVFSAIYITNPKFAREDWRGAVGYLEEKIRDGEVILMAFPEPFAAFRWYWKKENVAFGLETELGKKVEEQTVQKLVKGKAGVYTLDYLMDLTDPERITSKTLSDAGFKEVEIVDFRGVGQIRYWLKR